ncbi:MAG: hypothetical protein J5588_04135 [Bacteroidales bacterium]|nr:hypothetical protein [Bacteroidales bacterium]
MTEKNLDLNIAIALEIIRELPNTFDSHDFIKKYAKQNEIQYIHELYSYGSFRTYHLQIGKELLRLSENGALPIIKIMETKSEDVFGNIDEIAKWRKK